MKRNGEKSLAQFVITCLIVLLASVAVYAGTLKEEFDNLCVNTQDAESLSVEKLQELVTECDQLKTKIEQSNDRQKKLLLFRLNKCRNFLAYIIDHKQGDKSSSPQ